MEDLDDILVMARDVGFIEKEKINIKDNVHTLYKKYSMSQDKLKINKKYFSMYIDQLRNKSLKK